MRLFFPRPFPFLLLLLLLPPFWLAAPAHAQELEISEKLFGKSAYLPFKLVIRFPRPEAPINLSISAVGMSPQRTTQTFESVVFETEEVDTFTIKLVLSYRSPPFAPIVIEPFSGGTTSGSKSIPITMPTVRLTITISTSKEPHYPTVEEIWQYQNKMQLEAQRAKEAQEAERWNTLNTKTTTLEYLLYVITLVSLVNTIFLLSSARR